MQTRLKSWLSWQPEPEEFLRPLRAAMPWTLKMDGFQRGIDNLHIDVVLSARFTARAAELVRRMINQDIEQNLWPDAGPAPSNGDMDAFRAAYMELGEVAVDRARISTRNDWTRLLQLAVFRFLLQLVPKELQWRINQMKDQNQTSSEVLELHDRVVLLAKEETAVRYRVNRRLFRLVQKIETTNLRRVRKSILGKSWPIPHDVMFNPLLQLPSMWADNQVMNHYPLLCTEKEAEYGCFETVNSILVDAFRDFLPDWAQPPSVPDISDQEEEGTSRRLRIAERRDQGGLASFLEIEMFLERQLQVSEYEKPRFSWLDVPENLDLIMYSAGPLQELQGETAGNVFASPWPQKEWQDFQRKLMLRLLRSFERADLLKHIVAAYKTPRILRTMAAGIPARLVYQYLTGSLERSKLYRRLETMFASKTTTDIMDRLEREIEESKQLTTGKEHAYLSRFLHDFLCLRRDLKYAYKTFQAMDQIRLLRSNEDVELARTNGTLHDFQLQDEVQPEERRIRNHVVLKADVRGSTAITQQLREKNLNPATHFALNFFGPINKLLEEFGATKTFVEGDAVILSIFEYEGDTFQWLSVAFACGLAMRILRVMEAQNVQNRNTGLPELELGLGIAYSDESPTFLRDDDRKIMISSAINRVDHLSSCSPELRHAEPTNRNRAFGVEVVVPRAEVLPYTPPAEYLLRYNVNGVELDTPAFLKLRSELALRRVEFPGVVDDQPERYYAGRYPDHSGGMQWLIIREAPIRTWDGHRMGEAEQQGRRFYEVVVNPNVVQKVKEKLKTRQQT